MVEGLGIKELNSASNHGESWSRRRHPTVYPSDLIKFSSMLNEYAPVSESGERRKICTHADQGCLHVTYHDKNKLHNLSSHFAAV